MNGLPTGAEAAPPIHFSSLLTTCGLPNGYGYIPDCWPASHVIQLQPAPQTLQGEQQAAVDDWNFYLIQDALAPRFRINPGNITTDVFTVHVQSGSQYCGTFSDPGRDTVYIRRANVSGDPQSCQINAHTGTWSVAYRQELAGIIGWSESVEQNGAALFEPGLTTICVLYLDNTQPNGSRFINPSVCAHEADGIILAYRAETATVGTGRMFRDTLYMHVALSPAAATIQVGDSVRVLADSFYSGGLGTGGPPALTQVQGHIPVAKSVPPGGVSWFSRSSSAASRGNGWFIGSAQGSAWVGARANGSPSAATRWWSPLKQRGDSILVSVNPAPPPPPPSYVVTADETPIWTPGTHTFTAHIGSPSSTIYWRVDDSRTTSISPDTAFSTLGPDATLHVTAGSYTLTFQVSLSQFGGFEQQDIPVCTQSGESLQGTSKSGGGSTDAVENCPPPPGSGEQ